MMHLLLVDVSVSATWFVFADRTGTLVVCLAGDFHGGASVDPVR
jgi:hypothetical protein